MADIHMADLMPVVGLVLSVMVGALGWIISMVAKEQVYTMRQLTEELRGIRSELADIKARVFVLEDWRKTHDEINRGDR